MRLSVLRRPSRHPLAEGADVVALNPYLSFRDTAGLALRYYQNVLGGELEITTFGSMPGGTGAEPDESELVMHGRLTTDDGMVIMASDTPRSMAHHPPQGVSISLSGSEVERLRAAWNGLSDSAQVTVPLAPAPWGGEFGMLVDRFGVPWMVAIDSAEA